MISRDGKVHADKPHFVKENHDQRYGTKMHQSQLWQRENVGKGEEGGRSLKRQINA